MKKIVQEKGKKLNKRDEVNDIEGKNKRREVGRYREIERGGEVKEEGWTGYAIGS